MAEAQMRPRLLLDEQVFGLEEFLRDSGWDVMKVARGRPDDDVIDAAKKHGYVVVSLDKKVLSRCRAQGIPYADVAFEDLARLILDKLARRFPGPSA